VGWVSLFGAVTGEEMRMAQFVTGAAMAAFIGVGFTPGLREHAHAIRLALLGLYLLTCLVFVAYVLMR
jgi:hypothetical protein